MIFVNFPFPCDLKLLDFGISANADQIKEDIASYLGFNQFSLFYNGKKLQDGEVLPDNSTVHVTFPLPGGKGGFGSMLRAIGAQIEKTTNREACRDLSGRRLRDINEEQRLKKWIAKEAEREAEKVRRRQARIERLKQKAPHKFFDFEYEKKISELPERIDEALSEGLQKVKQPKRPLEKSEAKLPKKSWLTDDLPVTSSDSDSEETDVATTTKDSPSKKRKMMPRESSGCESEMSESSVSCEGPSRGEISKYSLSCPGPSRDEMSESSLSCPGPSRDEMSESSLSSPSSSRDKMPKSSLSRAGPSRDSCVIEDSSSSCDSMNAFRQKKSEENNTTTEKMEITQDGDLATGDPSATSAPETKVTLLEENTKDIKTNDMNKSTERLIPVKDTKDAEKAVSESSDYTTVKQAEAKDNSPIELMEFGNASELEALGLDRLKSALMMRGLKCGGTLSDRAQRLWKVRGLQPHEYPANLLAKAKK